MLSLSSARKLKKAGLEWQPQLHDMFAIPDRELDDRRFVLTEVLSYIELFRGSPVVTFHGTAEWALDFVLQTEAVWIPSETQLRELILQYASNLVLEETSNGYECHINFRDQPLTFADPDACEAYGAALLQLLWRQGADPESN